MAKVPKLPTIRSLYADHIDCRSVDVDDWSAVLSYEGDEGKAFAIEAATCEECGAVLVTRGGGGHERHKEIDSDATCEGYIPGCDGPMMNYHYPIGKLDDAEECARRIAHLPLCIVEWPDGKHSLALTGGGMDLSWEICEAFMLCGQLPPVNFQPPKMADRWTPRRAHVLAAYLKSCAVQAKRARAAAREARDTKRWYEQREREAKQRKAG